MSHPKVDDTGAAMSTTIAAHYKTRFHREVIFTTFEFNPELPMATVKDAVEARRSQPACFSASSSCGGSSLPQSPFCVHYNDKDYIRIADHPEVNDDNSLSDL